MVPNKSLYAAFTKQLRAGSSRYSVSAGKLRDIIGLDEQPYLGQLSYKRGFSNLITGYGGLQVSKDYAAAQMGTSFTTGLGAFSASVTQSRVSLPNRLGKASQHQIGKSYELAYSKNIESTGSNVTIAAYRFSDSGFYDLVGGLQLRELYSRRGRVDGFIKPKYQFTLSANQRLPEHWGQFYINATQQRFWNDAQVAKNYQVG